MPLIRDTIDPTREREVSEVEALSLERMGLLLTGTRARTDDGLRAAAVRQVQRRAFGDDDTPDAPDAPDVDNSPTTDADGDADTETPGADPASTTDDSPTTDASPQED